MSSKREYKRKARKRAEQEGIESTIEGLYEHGKRRLVALAKSEKADQEQFQRRQAQVGLASNILGITAGTAALATAAKNPALRPSKATMDNAGPVSRRVAPKLKSLKGKKGLIMAGAGGALALQGANLGGDLVANRVLSREAGVKKNDDAKNVAVGTATGAATGGAVGYLMGRGLPPGRTAQRARVYNSVGNEVMGRQSMRQMRRLEWKADPKGTIKRRFGSLATKNKFALAGATAGAGLGLAASASSVNKSIEQSYVSKSDEVAVTGHGVNIEKGVPNALRSRSVLLKDGPAGGYMSARRAAHEYGRASSKAVAEGSGLALSGVASGRVARTRSRARLTNPALRNAKVEKRQFDAEADRQRRLGLYAGLGALGAGGFGAAAASGLKTEGRRTDGAKKGQLFRIATKDGQPMSSRRLRGKAGLAALAAASGIGGVAAYRRGISERNYPYN